MDVPSITYTVSGFAKDPISDLVDDAASCGWNDHTRAALLSRAAGIEELACDFDRNARLDAATTRFTPLEPDELTHWRGYLNDDVTGRRRIAVDIPDEVLEHLKVALDLECFVGYVILRRRGTREAIIMGTLNTARGKLYFPIVFWGPSTMIPPTIVWLREFNKAAEAEATLAREFERTKREAEQELFTAEARRAQRLARICRGMTGIILVGLNAEAVIQFKWWSLIPIIITLFGLAIHVDYVEDNTRRRVLKTVLLPLLGLILLIGGGLTAAYEQFGTYSKTLTLCGIADPDVVAGYDPYIYVTPTGEKYRVAPGLTGELASSSGIKVEATITRHGIWGGDPTVTSYVYVGDDYAACASKQ